MLFFFFSCIFTLECVPTGRCIQLLRVCLGVRCWTTNKESIQFTRACCCCLCEMKNKNQNNATSPACTLCYAVAGASPQMGSNENWNQSLIYLLIVCERCRLSCGCLHSNMFCAFQTAAPPIVVAYLLNDNGLKRIRFREISPSEWANESSSGTEKRKKCDMEVVYRLFVCEWRMMLSLIGVPKRLIGWA